MYNCQTLFAQYECLTITLFEYLPKRNANIYFLLLSALFSFYILAFIRFIVYISFPRRVREPVTNYPCRSELPNFLPPPFNINLYTFGFSNSIMRLRGGLQNLHDLIILKIQIFNIAFIDFVEFY